MIYSEIGLYIQYQILNITSSKELNHNDIYVLISGSNTKKHQKKKILRNTFKSDKNCSIYRFIGPLNLLQTYFRRILLKQVEDLYAGVLVGSGSWNSGTGCLARIRILGFVRIRSRSFDRIPNLCVLVGSGSGCFSRIRIRVFFCWTKIRVF